jgi:hypothetical protein
LQGILLFVSTDPTCLHRLIVVVNTCGLLEIIPGPDNGSHGRTVALGLTQALTEMSTGNSSWGVKTAGA